VFSLHADVEAAAETEQSSIIVLDGVERGCALIGHHQAGGILLIVVIALRRLIAQREFERIVRSLEAGLLQRTLEMRRSMSSVSERSTIRRDLTWPSPSISRRTSIRPSSGGSRRISKRFLPALDCAAISTARPATGTVAAGAGVGAAAAAALAAAVLWVGAAWCTGALTPRFCTRSAPVFTAAAESCERMAGSGAASAFGAGARSAETFSGRLDI